MTRTGEIRIRRALLGACLAGRALSPSPRRAWARDAPGDGILSPRLAELSRPAISPLPPRPAGERRRPAGGRPRQPPAPGPAGRGRSPLRRQAPSTASARCAQPAPRSSTASRRYQTATVAVKPGRAGGARWRRRRAGRQGGAGADGRRHLPERLGRLRGRRPARRRPGARRLRRSTAAASPSASSPTPSEPRTRPRRAPRGMSPPATCRGKAIPAGTRPRSTSSPTTRRSDPPNRNPPTRAGDGADRPRPRSRGGDRLRHRRGRRSGLRQTHQGSGERRRRRDRRRRRLLRRAVLPGRPDRGRRLRSRPPKASPTCRPPGNDNSSKTPRATTSPPGKRRNSATRPAARANWNCCRRTPDHCLDFNPGRGPKDDTFGITVEPEETLIVDLQWAEPWFGVEADLDAYLLDSAGEPLIRRRRRHRATTSSERSGRSRNSPGKTRHDAPHGSPAGDRPLLQHRTPEKAADRRLQLPGLRNGETAGQGAACRERHRRSARPSTRTPPEATSSGRPSTGTPARRA